MGGEEGEPGEPEGGDNRSDEGVTIAEESKEEPTGKGDEPKEDPLVPPPPPPPPPLQLPPPQLSPISILPKPLGPPSPKVRPLASNDQGTVVGQAGEGEEEEEEGTAATEAEERPGPTSGSTGAVSQEESE